MSGINCLLLLSNINLILLADASESEKMKT